MAHWINGPVSASIAFQRAPRELELYPFGIGRLRAASESGLALRLAVNRQDDSAEQTLFVRVIEVGTASQVATVHEQSFYGVVSDRRDQIETVALDAIDVNAVQYVQGRIVTETGTGSIEPFLGATNTLGAEPWIIEWCRASYCEVVGVVMARSEAEAAQRCDFTRKNYRVRERWVYSGQIAVGGAETTVQLIRQRDLPKFPF